MSLNMQNIIWDELVDITDSRRDTPEISYNFTVDPLLISCTLHRLIKESRVKHCNWSLVEHMDKIISNITDQDRIFAEAVKSYYMTKLLMAKLRGDELTKYKSDLLKCLHDSSLSLSSKFVGMIYKLPCFYEYDMQLIEIFGGEYNDISRKFYKDREDVTLSFISKADNGQKRARHYEYWFKDSDDVRILLEVEKHNPVRNIWEQSIKLGTININAVFEKKRRDNLEFYVARAWSVNV